LAGEALSHVQGESLKGSAAVYWRVSHFPVTSTLLVVIRERGEDANA
jgi:hypothetical protein